MKLLSCNSNRPLAEKMAQYLGTTLIDANITRFSDGEVFVEVNENLRGEDVFIVQSTSTPANEHIMELLICLDAVKRASANRITVVIPYYGYARQDRKPGPRTPISAKLVANILTSAGANRVLTLDLHAGQIQGFFDIPLDNLYASPVMVQDIQKNISKDSENLLIVSPDVGGVVRARALAKRLECSIAIIDKRREKAGVSEVMNVIGEVEGKDCILFDDMVDSGGTLCNAAGALMDKGAKSVNAYITHGVFSGKAIDKIENSCINQLSVTDSIKPRDDVLGAKKVRILSIAELLAEAVKRISEETSVSSLFK